MKRKTVTKIIYTLVIVVFVAFVFNLSTVNKVQAVDNSLSNLYSNPNQGGSTNPYKFKLSSVVNSQLLTQVVGCTGVVNKVSTWMIKFLQSPYQTAKMAAQRVQAIWDQIQTTCASGKAGVEGGLGAVPFVNDIVKAADTVFATLKIKGIDACADKVLASDDQTKAQLVAMADKQNEEDIKAQCLDGIAATLAKNQLTAMTRSAMNWINTGYGGNPFFVQNMRNFTTSIERNVVETGINSLLSPALENPYAADFARSTVASSGMGLGQSSAEFLGGLQSSLENFISDPQSYYSNEQISNAERAQRATEAYATNFGLGGWNAWLSLTQTPQNNPLGFNMIASQYIADMESQQVADKKDELTQNNGFLSQRTCTTWQMYDKDGNPKTNSSALTKNGQTLSTADTFVYKTTPPIYQTNDGEHDYGVCIDWKVTTPGSIIRDKVTNYVNSPERQLELAKTINDSLNALFSVLISKLEGNGLSGLSDSSAVTSSNWSDSINSLTTNSDNNNNTSQYDNSGAYDGFNITKDLGNTYIHSPTTSLGNWNANTNTTSSCKDTTNLCIDISDGSTCLKEQTVCGYSLYPDTSPAIGDGKLTDNTYFTVTTAGKTKLMNNGYNDWQVGDRAFWDGQKWQDWKCGSVDSNGNCTNQISPIQNRGVIQIQQDYIVAAKEILKVLPGIMPALGELDYCLPGPNPSYQTNSSDAQSAFSNWINSSYVGPIDTSGERYGVKIDYQDGDSSFDQLHNIYGNDNIWRSVRTDYLGKIVDPNNSSSSADFNMANIVGIFTNICNNNTTENLQSDISGYDTSYSNGFLGIGGHHSAAYNCSGNYFYAKKGEIGQTAAANLDFKSKIKDYLSNYVNNYMLDQFFSVFGKHMDQIYFKNMTSPYIEHENRTLNPATDKNPAYVPMAQSGFDFTKDIVNYAANTTQAQKDYNDAITQAQVNISKLDPIKAEVSSIIKDAQNTRNKNLATKLGYNSVDAFTKDYKDCLGEEDVKFYDVGEIMSSTESRNAGSCSDGIDNDLDGLVDGKDPDCAVQPDTTHRRPPSVKGNIESPVETTTTTTTN